MLVCSVIKFLKKECKSLKKIRYKYLYFFQILEREFCRTVTVVTLRIKGYSYFSRQIKFSHKIIPAMKNLVIFSFFAVVFMSCIGQKSENIVLIQPHQLQKKLSDSIQLVDVRTSQEFLEGHIEGAVNIDVNRPEFSTEIQKMDKSKPVYIYCRSGKRSASAADKMEELGFTRIYDLSGGIISWEKATKNSSITNQE